MAWHSKLTRSRPHNHKKGRGALAVTLPVAIIAVGIVAWNRYVMDRDVVDTTLAAEQSTEEAANAVDDDVADAQEQPALQFDAAVLQPIVDTWVAAQTGRAGVVVMDEAGGVLASHEPDGIFFGASLYKLYVAYYGYLQLDNAEIDPDEPYVGQRTRLECLDAMIRSSDSPCAETLWNELGKQVLTERLQASGIMNTNMTTITTTAADAAGILQRIIASDGELSPSSQALYLDSLLTQDAIYRRGLPNGFSDAVAVYNKVGWNELVEWHDAAIVQLPDDRRVIVSVLTENVGTAGIRQLATSLELALVTPSEAL